MNISADIILTTLAAMACQGLGGRGIATVLTGGAVVSIYSDSLPSMDSASRAAGVELIGDLLRRAGAPLQALPIGERPQQQLPGSFVSRLSASDPFRQR